MTPLLVDAFGSANWPKPASIFEQYLQEQTENQRLVWIAMKQEQIAGYITLKWRSLYPPFQQQDIPEIMDFNVLPQFRRQGIGTALLLCAEQYAFKHHETIGLGVGLYADYGQPLQIYIKHGYKPDGRGTIKR
jgi:GNAT superfamily N-acetyltransferase